MMIQIEAFKRNTTLTKLFDHITNNKLDASGFVRSSDQNTIEKYKIHLMAKGFTQMKGIEYNGIFAPICHNSFDCNNVRKDLIEEVYM